MYIYLNMNKFLWPKDRVGDEVVVEEKSFLRTELTISEEVVGHWWVRWS